MKPWGITLLLILLTLIGRAQTGFNCTEAITLTDVTNFCSGATEYSVSTSNQSGTAWFKFTATKTDVTIIAKGNTAEPLFVPNVFLTTGCADGNMVGSVNTLNNITTFYKGGLTVGSTYYIKIDDANNDIGSFQLCINNFSSPVQAGQDCATAVYLCNNAPFRQNLVRGAGANPNESIGTCIGGNESNSVWYKWRAASSGKLVFTITPDNTTDDIDFVLYDLGPSGDCANATAANALRCAAGHGVDNSGCPNEPTYYKTGLNFTETDVSEESGCGNGQNGMLRYVDMEQGHVYALLVNNFTSINAGMDLSFTDQNGVAGTATFDSPEINIATTLADPCLANRTYTINSQASNYTNLKWDFGTGATLVNADVNGNYTVYFDTPGAKTITLTATNDIGCSTVATQVLNIPLVVLPSKPVISINKTRFCIGDVITMNANKQDRTTYVWSGPDNFTSDLSTVNITIDGLAKAGTYTLTAYRDGCASDPASLVVDNIYNKPVAAFTTLPKPGVQVNNIPFMLTVQNQSLYADSYLWEFGDGGTSTLENPVHEYTKPGTYYIKLTAFNQNVCATSALQGTYIVDADNAIYIPNTFTPNAAAINDLFGVSIINVNTYQLQIFTRWGELIFQSKSPQQKWDGTYGNKPMPQGTYYFVLNATSVNGKPIKKSGYVALVR
jgi:gliding motility-associated-like protein